MKRIFSFSFTVLTILWLFFGNIEPVFASNICPVGAPPECNDCVLNGGKPSGKMWTALGCVNLKDTNTFVAWVFGNLVFVASGAAFLLMVFGALQILTSAGNPEKVKAGQELITSALSGLLFIILSLFILKLIGVEILQIPGL